VEYTPPPEYSQDTKLQKYTVLCKNPPLTPENFRKIRKFLLLFFKLGLCYVDVRPFPGGLAFVFGGRKT
jgi:hypothetical protein